MPKIRLAKSNKAPKLRSSLRMPKKKKRRRVAIDNAKSLTLS